MTREEIFAQLYSGDTVYPPPLESKSALLEVTTGVQEIASLPLPLAWRTALIAAATGFGGLSILLQNRAAAGAQAPSVIRQTGWQAVHGALSGLLALGMMLLWGGET